MARATKQDILAKYDAEESSVTDSDMAAAKALLDGFDKRVVKITLYPTPFRGGNYGWSGFVEETINGETVRFQSTAVNPTSKAVTAENVKRAVHKLANQRKRELQSGRESTTLQDKIGKLSDAELLALFGPRLKAMAAAASGGEADDEDEDE